MWSVSGLRQMKFRNKQTGVISMDNKHNKLSQVRSLLGALCVSSLCVSTAFADDTEVFFGQVDPSLDIFPNVLFVLDTSGSMNWKDGGPSSRLERMKDALDVILDNATNVNVGLMRFNGTRGGGSVLFPVTSIDKELCEQEECGEISAAPRVTSSANDAEELISDGNMSLNGNNLGLGKVDAGAQAVGMRFEKINIPQGSKITSAKLEFTARGDGTDPTLLTITGEKIENAAEYTGSDGDISGRPQTTAFSTWSPDEWSEGLTYQSEDLSGVLQEIVNQAGWCGGNAVAISIKGTGKRAAHSFDSSASAAPALKYTYDSANIPNGGGCINKSAVSQVAKSSDDAEEFVWGGNTNTNSQDLEMPYDGRYEQILAMRFEDIKVPKGAVITNASIEFEVERTTSGNVSLDIVAEARDNPATYKSRRRNISSRPKTSSRVRWSNIPALNRNEKATTADLRPIVQELVNRNGWRSGNAMAFMFSHVSGDNIRRYETIDGEPANAPKIRIDYQSTIDDSSPTYITARDRLKEVVNGLTATGGTPIVDAYYEAAQYFRGGNVDYGTQRGPSRSRYHRVSVPESYTGGSVNRHNRCTDSDLDSWYCRSEQINGTANYITPFRSSCQTNHIVFLSDGAATSNSAFNKVKSLTGKTNCSNANPNEQCGEELAEWLNETDHAGSMNGKQNISTYTIGFNINSPFLQSIASEGGGGYYQAESSAQLVDVFQSILGDVLSVDTSFVAPGATVNQFNRLTHRNDIYFALFKPNQRPGWKGNLKRYEVGKDSNGDITILDVNGNAAVDKTSGFFDKDSRSWWSDDPDGNQVAEGGAARELEFNAGNPRRIFTFIGDYTNDIPSTGVDLTAASQALHEDNDSITIEDMGLAHVTTADQAGYRESLLKWARGVDLKDDDEDGQTNDWRQHMGDPMHARPVILNYADSGKTKTSIFVGTNEGYLHSIDREEGQELYSYVPKELLENFDVYWNNQSSDAHPYGLDGVLSIWTTDDNDNVVIDSGEKAFLYTGMRRGGSNYYALDVASRLNPKLAWVIEAGQPGFEELGQTWSKMSPTKIRFNNEERNVLIFGAGYDTNQDVQYEVTGSVSKRVKRQEAGKGRGIYIVDAETGKLIWSALGTTGGNQQFADMDYSIPSNLRILDTNYDGFADQIYASDTGGQVWRFDFTQFHQSGPLLQGGVLANLSTGDDYDGERRFYYEPDVAIISNDGDRFISISIGSGWRAHPLDLLIDDRFYMIKTGNLFDQPDGYGKTTDGGQTYQPITEADLIDITNNLTPEVNQFGWRYDLGATGEKVLGASVTANNQVIFTSYRPALSVGACTTAIGGGSVYALNIIDGSPTVDMNGDGEIDEEDREKELAHGGIPPEPAVLITDDGPTLLAGPEQPFTPDFKNLTRRTFWVDNGEDEGE